MHESTTPLAVDRADLATIPDLLARRAQDAPGHVAFIRRDATGALHDVTTAEFALEVEALARGLIAAGVGSGDRVVVMAPTRYEWAVADLAIWTASGVVVPVYETSAERQIAAIIDETRPVLAIVATADHAARVARAAPELGVWTMDPSSDGRSLADLVSGGTTIHRRTMTDRLAALRTHDIATIVYTSGTTAKQKGVQLTHNNVVRLVLNVAAVYEPVVNDRAVTIVALPLAHILARALQLCAIAVGMTVAHEGDPTKVVATFAEVRPTFMVVVPRVLEKVRAAARARAADARMGSVFAAAERTAIEWARVAEARQDDAGVRPGLGLRAQHALFDRLFYARLRALLGGRLSYLLSGAAPLDPDLARFFWGLGVPVIEGYGLTETTAPITGARLGDLRPGSVGTPMPGSAVRISDGGEVEVRGIGVFGGYEDAADNLDAFTSDGWFRTGDVGRLDGAGRLWLQGRSKNLIVTASGKNVAPEPWEAAMARSVLVSQAVVVGDGKPFLTAVLMLDRDAVERWADKHGHTDLAARAKDAAATGTGTRLNDPALLARLQRSVDRANAEVSRAEQVRRFVPVIADLTDASGFFTPTLKLRRDAYVAAAVDHVHHLYEGDPR